MKAFTKFFFVSTICLVFVSHQIGAQELKGKSLIEKVCQGSGAKDLCTSILLSDPGSQKANENSLAMTALTVAQKNATSIIEHVKVLDGDNNLDPNIEQALDDCLDTFEDAEDQLENAIGSLMSGNAQDAQTWVQAALAASNTCGNSMRGNDRILLNKTETFRQLCNISLYIIKNLPNPK